MLASFFSQPVVWSTSLIELLTIVGLFGFLAGIYRNVECHQQGCHRFGRFPHGHYKLCRIHHPHVPTAGKIDKEHIEAIRHPGDNKPVLEAIEKLKSAPVMMVPSDKPPSPKRPAKK